MKRFTPLDLSKIKTYSVQDRPSKVSRRDFGRPHSKGGGLADFLSKLPRILAAGDFSEVVERLARAAREKRTIILAMGGHPVKVGLSPIIIDLMKRGVISLLAVNGSVMVHDTEAAMIGSTSEDVQASLGDGHFGMAREPNQLINRAAALALEKDLGLGQALGQTILQQEFPFQEDSLFASAAQLGVPVCVHVALGTDVYQIHPQADGGNLGQASFRDFHIFCSAVATLQGGAFINLGSAVIMPEVFLKAVTLVRNLGHHISDLTTLNMDFIRQYRPQVNVVQRPTHEGGKGFNLVGHHEIMFPLLAAALIERLE